MRCTSCRVQISRMVRQYSSRGTEPPVDELDEAEIERSIREINEAIKRSAQKKP